MVDTNLVLRACAQRLYDAGYLCLGAVATHDNRIHITFLSGESEVDCVFRLDENDVDAECVAREFINEVLKREKRDDRTED